MAVSCGTAGTTRPEVQQYGDLRGRDNVFESVSLSLVAHGRRVQISHISARPERLPSLGFRAAFCAADDVYPGGGHPGPRSRGEAGYSKGDRCMWPNSNHFGTAGFFCRLAAEQQMIGITMCNGEPGVCSPAGTRAAIGPNRIAVGAARPARSPSCWTCRLRRSCGAGCWNISGPGRHCPKGLLLTKREARLSTRAPRCWSIPSFGGYRPARLSGSGS